MRVGIPSDRSLTSLISSLTGGREVGKEGGREGEREVGEKEGDGRRRREGKMVWEERRSGRSIQTGVTDCDVDIRSSFCCNSNYD